MKIKQILWEKKNRRFVNTEFVKTCDELVSSVSSIGSFVEKKSCSSTEELYPNGKSKKTAKYSVTYFFSAAAHDIGILLP